MGRRPGAAVVAGGDTRSASVRAGLAAIAPDTDIVVVHDAARPLASPELFELVIDAVRAGADAAVPALPVADTLKRVDGDRVVETVDRTRWSRCRHRRRSALGAAREHERGDDATDDAALVEAAGGTVVIVAGDPRNLKVTTVADLASPRRSSRGRRPRADAVTRAGRARLRRAHVRW